MEKVVGYATRFNKKLKKILFSPLHIPYHYNQFTFSVKKVLLFLLRA